VAKVGSREGLRSSPRARCRDLAGVYIHHRPCARFSVGFIPIEYDIQNKFPEYRVTTITIITVVRYACTQVRGQGATKALGALRNMVRILFADGQAVVRRGLRILLEARPDFEVCAEASTGCEAVELALRHRPDVAILDISLPLVSGAEATRQIRKAAPETEVMIFTLQNGESEIRDVLHAGARGLCAEIRE